MTGWPAEEAVAKRVAMRTPGTMTSRERVLAALSLQEGDRVPIDLGSTWISTTTIPFYEELKRHFGIDRPTELMERNMQVCHIDEEILAPTLGRHPLRLVQCARAAVQSEHRTGRGSLP